MNHQHYTVIELAASLARTATVQIMSATHYVIFIYIHRLRNNAIHIGLIGWDRIWHKVAVNKYHSDDTINRRLNYWFTAKHTANIFVHVYRFVCLCACILLVCMTVTALWLNIGLHLKKSIWWNLAKALIVHGQNL